MPGGGRGTYARRMLVLTVMQGPDAGRKYELPQQEPQLIGRSSEALPLTDTTVSRRHAELTPDGDVWWIRDLHSQNGTYINGFKIAARTRLHAGDQIRVGNTVFVFGRAGEDDLSVVRLVRGGDEAIAARMPSSEDSVAGSLADSMVLAEPDPRAAAAEHLRVIYQLVALTGRVTDVTALLGGVMDLVFEIFEPERGAIIVRPGLDGVGGKRMGDEDAGIDADELARMRPTIVRYRDQTTEENDARIRISRTILRHALEDAHGVLSSNAQQDRRFASGESVQLFDIRSAICSPIRFKDSTYGAIYIDSSRSNFTFAPSQLALMNAIGQHTGLALANAEQTRRIIASERLAAIGETVASLSHSIRNIIQGLRGGADVVEMGLTRDNLDVARNGWSVLKRNLDRIVSLTMNMLAFSKRRRVELRLVPIGGLLAECLQLYERASRDRGIALLLDVDPDMPPVPVDPGLIHQAVLNLVGNAIDAVPPARGVVTVSARYREGGDDAGATLEIGVSDNGPGIPRDKLDWIFEPFNSTKGTRGTGLGLAVTKRIAIEHNGAIHVDNAEGGGATFRMTLPADASAVLDPSATAGEP